MPMLLLREGPVSRQVNIVLGFDTRCREGDSNPHGLPRRILSAMRLPFRHPGGWEPVGSVPRELYPTRYFRRSSPAHGNLHGTLCSRAQI